jgi:uncharacterized membrane protein YkvA (DUF1232 family)
MPKIRLGRKRSRRKSAIQLLRELPNFIKLLVRLLRDARVSKLDRALFAVVIAYVLLPIDLLPDFLGFTGLFDDLPGRPHYSNIGTATHARSATCWKAWKT